VRKLDFCIVTLREIPLVLVLKKFQASKGWFDNFKKRAGIHSVGRHGEAAISNKDVAEKFVENFKDFVDREGFIPEQVFNCDETGLSGKKKKTKKDLYHKRRGLARSKAYEG